MGYILSLQFCNFFVLSFCVKVVIDPLWLRIRMLLSFNLYLRYSFSLFAFCNSARVCSSCSINRSRSESALEFCFGCWSSPLSLPVSGLWSDPLSLLSSEFECVVYWKIGLLRRIVYSTMINKIWMKQIHLYRVVWEISIKTTRSLAWRPPIELLISFENKIWFNIQ